MFCVLQSIQVHLQKSLCYLRYSREIIEWGNTPGVVSTERWVVSRPLVQSLKSGSGRGSVSRNIACPTCHKTYSSQHTLRRHMRLECGKEPQFHCPYCPRKTKQRYNLMLHIARAHKPEHHLQSPWT
ncbi:unnamed protein product [Nezara viridula]|uniref:C2H2-type domain-containing protein n=1 Tax=Nezara viridula TaxID=85310 RepID=A0A9P0MP39_NEZVI|nr:unnamed protein product [Nezara viridula]